MKKQLNTLISRHVVFAVSLVMILTAQMDSAAQETVRDRLWLWGHPPGVFNNQLRKVLGKESTTGPVAAALIVGRISRQSPRYNVTRPSEEA